MLVMDKEDVWVNVFFSDNPPEFVGELNGEINIRPFHSEDENWKLGGLLGKTRQTDQNTIQVFWLLRHGRRTYIAKVFPDYTEKQAAEQLWRLRISKSQIPHLIDDAVHEFDRFFREARVYAHIDQFCSNRERIYFPRFHGVVKNLDRSRFSSGYAQRRAIVLEAIKPDIRSRRILAETTSLPPESYSESYLQTLTKLPLSPFEHEWYRSLLSDRLRRLNALHRMGITHGDVQDWHFRLPDDFHDTVLYDFSEAYTFSPRVPFRVNHGKPRPLSRVAEGERRRVELQIEERAKTRDLRSHLIKSSSEQTVDNALWQPLDQEEEGKLELIILKVWTRPDYFSMPTLNSVFPFLEYLGRKLDPGWPIRRARLLDRYECVWAIPDDDANCSMSIVFNGEPQFTAVDRPYLLLCLIPKSWGINDTALGGKLRHACSSFVSSGRSGRIIERSGFVA
ncbi:hypothetical protein BO78DRAFT_371017 [Aspergillus sclerotiicarbonarius CBS 121057]|uniref:Protein kinase domain-containing protein n=1 Tax=Aspergillus sclerotiicarbonarius (strain CBS 121057 / IBT 28362) TaxID=1448318 RepID=A0A319EBR0_ASPSB|nr:hypothetical protein BO78DRAFT_371017 [Aspergillus sclerotiicarbonarius CBS 121057]